MLNYRHNNPMNKQSKNFNRLLKSFRNKWVAVSDDYGRVFASGNTLQATMKKIKDRADLKVFRVIPFYTIYSF